MNPPENSPTENVSKITPAFNSQNLKQTQNPKKSQVGFPPPKKSTNFPQIIFILSLILITASAIFFTYSFLSHKKAVEQKPVTVSSPTPT